MIDIKSILYMLLMLLPFLLCIWFEARANIPKARRSAQFSMPVVALLYAVITMCFSHKITEGLISFIQSIPDKLSATAASDKCPQFLTGFLNSASTNFAAFITKINLNFWVFFVANIVILLGFVIVKKILNSIALKLANKNNNETLETIHEKISGEFYFYFPQRDVWCVQAKFVSARSYIRVFYIASIVISCILLIVSGQLYLNGYFTTVYYPVFGLIMIGEIYHYMNGSSAKEHTNNVIGEDEDAYKVTNYTMMKKYLRVPFRDKLDVEATTVNNKLFTAKTDRELLDNIMKMDTPELSTFGRYMDGKVADGLNLDVSYLYSTLNLLRGQSILFASPFYRDLIPYVSYPMNRTLLSGKKVLIILGRHGVEDNIKKWAADCIEEVTNIPFLWNIQVLDHTESDVDIGIISRSDIFDREMLLHNAEFLRNVKFCVVMEPSKLISTAQTGLNLIIKAIKGTDNKQLTYCLCDKNCDGLVDSMSHILMQSIVTVSPSPKHEGTSSYMCFEADDDNLTHRVVPSIPKNLGFGTEISFVALKSGVSQTWWYGGDAYPVIDQNWISHQYYYDLTHYAGIPTNDEEMTMVFHPENDMWSAEQRENGFLVVDDESNNLFEVLRNFETRSTGQGFVSVISPDYLLRDYMADNAEIFMSDPKAIPQITPDYVRSSKNSALKLAWALCFGFVSEQSITHSLELSGRAVFNVKAQLWYELYMCYASVKDCMTMPKGYTDAVEEAMNRKIKSSFSAFDFTSDIIEKKKRFDTDSGTVKTTYIITNHLFTEMLRADIGSAQFICEDEMSGVNYVGAELTGHIYQKYLPGQYFVIGGKYYQMEHLSGKGDCVVRRAADQLDGRKFYRQIRHYVITDTSEGSEISDIRVIDKLKISHLQADFTVDTAGYWSMGSFNDFHTAKKVIFEGASQVPQRHYNSKTVFRLEFPDDNESWTDELRFTMTVLLNEVFSTIFAENSPYIVALTDTSFAGDDILPVTCTIDTPFEDDKAVYIIEDSTLDIGLLSAFERNLPRILEIIKDYSVWQEEKVEEALSPEVDNESSVTLPPLPEPEVSGIFAKISKWFRSIFSSKDESPEIFMSIKKKQLTEEDKEAKKQKTKKKKKKKDKAPEEPAVPETPVVPAITDVLEDEDMEEVRNYINRTRPKYYESYFLLYGFGENPKHINVSGLSEYLTLIGYEKTELGRARYNLQISEMVANLYNPQDENTHYCDFCGEPISGVEYEVLADGRMRCPRCSRTAIKTEEDFKLLFDDVKRNLESFFGITINASIKVEMLNAHTLHKKLKKTFIPQQGRVLGVAIKDKHGYTLYVENGSPRLSAMMTIAHELTHIWQYVNWKDKRIRQIYGSQLRLQVYEGMAKWVEIQYAYLIGERIVAKREEINTVLRQDEYGYGFMRYRAQYRLQTKSSAIGDTPFEHVVLPLAKEYCGDSFPMPPVIDKTLFEDGEICTYIGKKKKKKITPDGKKKKYIQGRRDRTPGNISRFWRSTLNEEEGNVYDTIIEGLSEMNGDFDDIPAALDKQTMSKIVRFIGSDYPEIFWWNSWNYIVDEEGIVKSLSFNFVLSKEEAEQKYKEIMSELPKFIEGIDQNTSDFEVALRVYQNIINLVDYDSAGLDKENKNDDSTVDNLRSLVGVFVKKQAVCAAYAKAYQFILNNLGIECAYIVGATTDSANANHAWNMIKLEGDWYYVDVTWGDRSNTDKSKDGDDYVHYNYFCITTEELLRTHKPDNADLLPECTATQCNYYRRMNLFLEGYNIDAVKLIFEKAVSDGDYCISFKCDSRETYDAAVTSLFTNSKLFEVISYCKVKLKKNINESTVSYENDETNLIITVKLSTK